MTDFVSISCPICGNKLQITSDIERFGCAYCGNEHVVRRRGGIISLAPVTGDEEIKNIGKKEQEQTPTKKKGCGIWLLVIMIGFAILFAILLVITNPSQEQHEAFIGNYLVMAAGVAGEKVGGDIGALIGMVLGRAAESIVMSLDLFEYHNYILFSTMTLNNKIITFGVLRIPILATPVSKWVDLGDLNLPNISSSLLATPASEVFGDPQSLADPPVTPVGSSSFVTDDFDGPSLDPMWYWVREDPTHWSLTARPEWMQITTQSGEIWGGSGYNIRNILLQNLSNSPSSLEVSTKLAFNPTVDWQAAGLIIYKDDDNYVTLLYGYHTDFGGKSVRFQSEERGVGHEVGTTLTGSPSLVYLKIVKASDNYTGYFSLDNFSWTNVGEYSNGIDTPSIGLMTGNGTGIRQEAEAAFDYVRLDQK